MPLSCEMEIDYGRVQAIMAEVLLNTTDVDAGFQKMSGIAVPEGMNGDPFCDIKLFEHASQCPLHGGFSHGSCCLWTSSESGKDPFGVSMCDPVLS